MKNPFVTISKQNWRVILAAAVVLVAALAVGLALYRTSGYDPVKVTVTTGGKAQPIAIDTHENPPYIQTGSMIQLQLNDRFPDTVDITEIIANDDGSPKYDSRVNKQVEYTKSDHTISFAVESNWATALSSNSKDYQKGSTYRCYRVKCGWNNGDVKEYAVYIRTDPAITFDTAPPDTYAAHKWLDYYRDEQLPWNGSKELELPEYPRTIFQWTAEDVTARESNIEKTLFSGMPVWNVYLDDLTGDGLPELCATVSFGSGIVDTHVVVHDYAKNKHYELSDRMFFDYVLTSKDGHLLVTQSRYNGEPLATGDLVIVNDELTATGIDRTRPKVEPARTTAAVQ